MAIVCNCVKKVTTIVQHTAEMKGVNNGVNTQESLYRIQYMNSNT